MRHASLLFLLASPVFCASRQFFPLDRDASVPEIVEQYSPGQPILMDCIARHIDLGEHKLDEHKKMIHVPFPKCRETSLPLTFAYGVDVDQQCTVAFTDELYHLFQLYIHEDVPFSCRIPLSPEANYVEKGGAYIPLTFNFRGSIYDLHLQIDTSMNVLFTTPESKHTPLATIVSAIAFGLGTDTTKVAIGDHVTLDFAIRWLKSSPSTNVLQEDLSVPFVEGFYKLPMHLTLYPRYEILILRLLAATSSIILVGLFVVVIYTKRNTKYRPLDQEGGKSD